MTDKNNDLKELEHLLGHAKADYRALRHRSALQEPQPHRRRSIPVWPMAIAASVLLAVAVVLLGVLDPDKDRLARTPPRLALPAPVASPLTLRPNSLAKLHFSLDTSGLRIGSALPHRPTGSKG